MSLWRQRNAIEHAVAGQLSAEDDARLRSHLHSCGECRAHYDQLTTQARILAGAPHATKASSERELARLLGAIAPQPVAAPARRRWLPVLAAATAAAILLVLFIVQGLSPVKPPEEVVLRGTKAAPAAPAQPAMMMFAAPRAGGPLEKRATFPDQPLARAHATEWVAFKPAEGALEFRALVVGEGQSTLLGSGKSVALDPGRWRVFGLFLPPGFDETRLIDLTNRAGKDWRRVPLDDVKQTFGEIVVDP